MKLVRYGPAGKEKPGLIDADGKLRDLSRKVKDIDAATLAPGELAKLRKLDTKKLPLVKGKPRLGPASRRRRSSSPSASTTSITPRSRASRSPSTPSSSSSRRPASSAPNDNIMLPPDSTHTDWEVELGFVIGRTARHVAAQGRAQVRRRLLPDQRRVRARIPDEAQRVAVEQGQGLRHLRADRAVAGHDGRDQGCRRISTCGSTSTACAGRPAIRGR